MDLYKDFTEEELRILTRPSLGWGRGRKSWWNDLSPEEYREGCRRVSEGKIQGWSRIKSNPERYSEVVRLNSEGQRRHWEKLSPEERSSKCSEFTDRISNWRQGLSEEEYGSLLRKVSNSMKDYWESLSSEEKEYKLRNSFLRGSGQQSEPEGMVERWLDKNKPGEYKYNGVSKEVMLGGKVPDFINIDGKKEVIEVFGFYWHLRDNPEDLKAHYLKYGFDCKVIWEYECYDKDNIERILA